MSKGTFRKLFIVLGLIFITLICIYFFLHSSFFYIDKITVTGLKEVPRNDIIEISAITLGMNIFEIDNRLSSRAIELHPKIKDARVARHLPREIAIEVSERKTWAVMPYNEIFLCLDPEGVCIDRVLTMPSGDMCIITIDNLPQSVILGQVINAPGVQMIKKIYDALSDSCVKNISEYHYISQQEEVYIYTIQGTEVRFGNLDRLEEKAQLFARVLALENQVEQEGTGSLQYVDIRYNSQPVLMMR